MNREICQERLASVRARITVLRDALADPSSLSEISIDGVSEKIPRADLVKELTQLEREELTLMNELAGVSSRVFRVDLR